MSHITPYVKGTDEFPEILSLSQKPQIGLPVGELLANPHGLLKKLVKLSDFLEIKQFPEPHWLPKNKPRVFHWNYGLMEEEFFSFFPKIGPELKHMRMFSADLGPSAQKRQGILPLTNILTSKEMEKIAGKALDLIKKYYPGPVGLENYNYYPTGLYENICQPDYIGHFLDKFDLFMVLDLAHAEVSAHNLNMPLRQYLSQLPLEKVAEIHLSRPYVPRPYVPRPYVPRPYGPSSAALAVDTHYPPEKAQWNLLKWLLKKIPNPAPLVVIECYQSPATVWEAYTELWHQLGGL